MNNIMNIMSMMKQFRANPMQMLSQRFNLPQGIKSDPQAIMQHLLNSGQITQAQIDQAVQMKQMFTM